MPTIPPTGESSGQGKWQRHGPEVEKNLLASSSERASAGWEGGGTDEHRIKFLQGLREEL